MSHGTRTLVALATLGIGAAGGAQAPDDRWRTLRTAHLHVHFTPETEALARRAAGAAERAWARLAGELVPPRGPVDLVVADNADATNGFANVFPTNRITVFARPPIDDPALRFTDDWIDLVVAHELAHVFHLDRVRGWWRVAQWVFGRNPFLFPNTLAPRWISEGLAVHYETAITGAGRLAGAEFPTLAAVVAERGTLGPPSRWSLANQAIPGGQAAYAFGSQLMAHAARAGGPGSVRRFVEAGAGAWIPYRWSAAARDAFGAPWPALYDAWRATLPGARTPAGRDAFWSLRAPRWVGDTVFATGNDGRSVPALFRFDSGGRPRRVSRRNDVDVSAPLAGGGFAFAQADFTDPWRYRGDLYLERDGATRRVTRGARLTMPDARADGAVVAVRIVPGSSALVRVDTASGAIAPVVPAHPDTQWSEPRWSRRGDRIAAIRWTRGGESAVVILDTAGTILGVHAAARAVQMAPAWAPDDRTVVFQSDRDGRMRTHAVRLADGALVTLGDATPRYFAEPHRDGRLAAVALSGRGFALARGDTAAGPARAASVFPASRGDPVAADSSPARPYRAWRLLWPRYWIPAAGEGARGDATLGLNTSGRDVVHRHAWALAALVDTRSGDLSADFAYTYYGLGNPWLTLHLTQQWDAFPLDSAGVVRVGDLLRRKRTVTLSSTYSQPRVRWAWAVSAGADLEFRDFYTDPAPRLATLDPLLRDLLHYPGLFVGGVFTTVQWPYLAISPEDGVTLRVLGRQRSRSGADHTTTRNGQAEARAYKSVPLGGGAHHVIAVRAAAGYADDKGSTDFSAGGTSGDYLSIAPGVTLGDGFRPYAVRGFPVGSLRGIRALGYSAEWRAPIGRIGRGFGDVPAFVQRASVAAFHDAATAWCPAVARPSLVCPTRQTPRVWLASAGAELAVDATLLDYDRPYRFRLGVAAPVRERARARGAASAYVAVGLGF